MSEPEIIVGATTLRGKEAFRAAEWSLPFVLLINALRPWAVGVGITTALTSLLYLVGRLLL
jgi:hypothetical protein